VKGFKDGFLKMFEFCIAFFKPMEPALDEPLPIEERQRPYACDTLEAYLY